MTTANLTRRQKVDIALADLAAAGAVNPEQADSFIQTLLAQPTILKLCRVVEMNAPKMKINKENFGSRVLQPASQTGGQTDTGANGRYVPADKRVKPTLSKVEINTSEVICEIRIPDEFLEDNIEKGVFAKNLMEYLGKAAARDVEELVIQGDTASADPYLALQDGVLKLMSANVVDAGGKPMSYGVFSSMQAAVPDQFISAPEEYRYFVNRSTDLAYRKSLFDKNTAFGFGALSGGQESISVLDVPLARTSKMPTSSAVLTHPRNIVVGVQRDIRIESERDIRSRETVIVLTARIGVQVEEPLAGSKAINLI